MSRKPDRVVWRELKQLCQEMQMIRLMYNWTYAEVAEEAGVCKQTVENLLTRKTKFPQLQTVMLVCHGLQMPFHLVQQEFLNAKAKVRKAA